MINHFGTLSEYDFIILEEDSFKDSERYKQFLSDKKRYKELMIPFLQNTQLSNPYGHIPTEELKSNTIEYYASLNDDDKRIFSTYYDNFLMQYIAKFTAPIEKDFEAFKTMLHSVRDKTFWNIEPPHPVFGTISNERFFNYVMGCFKDDVRCYKQQTLSYMYWVMMKVIHRPMYIRYVNEHYAIDLNPIEKIKGRPQIEGAKVVDEYNQVFKKAQSKWNDENPLYQKNFALIYHVV